MLSIFKDNKRFGGNYDNSKGRLVGEADRLVEHILRDDVRVIDELLTTDKFYVFHSGDNEAMTASSERIRRIYEYFKDEDWQNFETEDLLKHKEFLAEVKMRGINVDQLATVDVGILCENSKPRSRVSRSGLTKAKPQRHRTSRFPPMVPTTPRREQACNSVLPKSPSFSTFDSIIGTTRRSNRRQSRTVKACSLIQHGSSRTPTIRQRTPSSGASGFGKNCWQGRFQISPLRSMRSFQKTTIKRSANDSSKKRDRPTAGVAMNR